MTAYVPLWVKSNFSFLEGASHPEEMLDAAEKLGISSIGLVDRDGFHGAVRAHVRAVELDSHLLIGAQVTCSGRGIEADTNPRVLLYAGDREAYGRICELLTLGRSRCEKGRSELDAREVCEAASNGMVAIGLVPEILPALKDAFGDRAYSMIARHRLDAEMEREEVMRNAARQCDVPTVAGNEVLYHHRSRRSLQDVLTCIRHRTTLTNAGRAIRANGEHDLKSPDAMRLLFADDPSSLARTLEIRDRVKFSYAQLRYRYPSERLPDGSNEDGWLRTLAFRGATVRYGSVISDAAVAQLERELEIISDLEYGGYFLTMWEVVQLCKREGILCQGRGSAANSVVCYCLGITAVDPIKLDLLFERFLSRERAEPPDIDLDIEHERREEVIQWMYTRYGRRYAAMVANVIRYRAKSAIRDVGKVLGLEAAAIDGVSRMISHYDGVSDEILDGCISKEGSPVRANFKRLVHEILDFPRHLSIHPGGFLLGHEPVDTLVPVEPATMEGRTVIQWDKYDVEALGLFKVDLLGLGALTLVKRSFALMQKHQGIELEMATVPIEDSATYEMASRGDTVGVFQIESRAQMAMLPRLRPRTFYDLVIEVAIVRPGPIQGDMVHPYLRRRSGQEPVVLPHPSLERVLARTLGVPIFQEQVMKLAVLVANYTPGESDQLRRDMAAWKSTGKIEKHHERLVSRMVANGISLEFAERVFSQISGFGEYGFPESHAASFALIAYVTAWLKCHHPTVFACALLNSQPMGFYTPSTIIDDAKRHDVKVNPIQIGKSEWDCSLEADTSSAGGYALRMGLRYVKGLGELERQRLESAGAIGFTDLPDFVRRTGLSLRSLTTLATGGALDVFGMERRDTLWSLRKLATERDDLLRWSDAKDTASLFRPLRSSEAVVWDYQATHHSTRGHPMESFRAILQREKIPSATEVATIPSGKRVSYVGMVICRQRPGTASGVVFYTLEDESGFVNLVVWTSIFEKYETIARTAGLLGVDGRIESKDGVTHLIADRLWVPEFDSEALVLRSRDFH